MAAAMASKTIFSARHDEKLKAYQVKMVWAEGSFSDPITILNVYEMWKDSIHTEDVTADSLRRERIWAARHFVVLKALKVQTLDHVTFS